MNVPFEYELIELIYERPAPNFSDLCSVQAAGANPADPILTIYRKQASTAIDWIDGAALDKRFEAYLLREGNGRWHVWDAYGDVTDGGDSLPITRGPESTTPVPVDRKLFLHEARAVAGDFGLALLACAESHSGASAADHSNLNVVCRRMIGKASPEDLEHFFLIDSRKWPCPVRGVFANVDKLSPAMQDVFLDRFKWLENSWPMVSREFHELLAGQLARLRRDYVSELLRQCGKAARMSENRITAMVAKWMLASPESSYRFALHIVATLREGLLYHQHSAETFNPEIVERHGAAVVKDYKKLLTLS